MGEIDRIQPVTPAHLQAQPSSGVEMRKDGRKPASDQPKRDKLELHDSEETDETLIDSAEVVELFPDEGLDLTA